MFLAKWLNRRWTDDDCLFAYMGLPEVYYSSFGGCVSLTENGVEKKILLSKQASHQWRRFLEEKVTVFYTPYTNRRATYDQYMVSPICVASGIVFFFILFVLPFEAGPWLFIVAFMLACLPNEIWTLVAISKLKLITEFTKDALKAEAWQIIEDNQRDLDLCAETKALLADYQARLTAHDIACGSDTEVRPAGTDAAWRVVDVQFHTVADHPFGRDVTITLSSDGQDGLTCVLPGEDSVTNWLDAQLREMQVHTVSGTHTYELLESLRAKNILKEVWQVPTDTLATVAKLVVSSKQPFTEREPVTVHGELLPGGHAMLQAIGFTGAADAETALVFAPTAPIQHLSAAVVELFRLKGQHPALRQLPKAA